MVTQGKHQYVSLQTLHACTILVCVHCRRDYNIGKVYAKSKGFVDYVRKSLRKLELELPKVSTLQLQCSVAYACCVCACVYVSLVLLLHSSFQGLNDERIQDYWKEYHPYRRCLFAFHQVSL